MDKISFFTAVSCDNSSNSTRMFLLEKVDSYFYLGGRKVKIDPGYTKGNVKGVYLVHSNSSLTALKVASYFTIVLPLILLIAKAILRANYDFYLIPIPRETVSNINLNSTLLNADELEKKEKNSEINVDSPLEKNSQIEDESLKQVLKNQEQAAVSI